MKIANEKTFEQYDQLVGRHKHQRDFKPKTTSDVKMPGSKFLKLALVVGTGALLLHHYKDSLEQYLLALNLLNPRQKMMLDAWRMYARSQWQRIKRGHDQSTSKGLANLCYSTQLESDYVYLTQRNPEKRLFLEEKSKFAFWVWGFGNKEKMRFINEYGDLMEGKKTSKIRLGSWLSLWGSREEWILKRQRVFDWYMKNKGEIDVRKECNRMNILNALQAKSEEYDAVIEQCVSTGEKIQKKIDAFVATRLKLQAKKGIKSVHLDQ